MTRISEPDLILPALLLIFKNPEIKTSELLVELREIFRPTGEDAELLHGRNDDKFSQIVRNLVSHHTLDHRLKYTFLDGTNDSNTSHRITQLGIDYLKENYDSLENLIGNDYGYDGLVIGLSEITKSQESGNNLGILDENVYISEGRKKFVKTEVYERSRQLRDEAIDYFSQKGALSCAACGFDFQKKYGNLGKGFIEIHHKKPIFQYENSDYSRTLVEAINDLIPLCANCHRMIHRKRDFSISIEELIDIITK